MSIHIHERDLLGMPPEVEVLAKFILRRFQSPSYQPPRLPSVAMELLSLNTKPGVEFNDITRVLERDTILTGYVLKVAQSPIYASRTRIQSLKDALVRLGLATLTDIFLSVSMNMRMFRSETYGDAMTDLQRHATATAHLSRLVCRQTSFSDEYAFLCGLLHDVGIAASLVVLGEMKKPPAFERAWPAVVAMHEMVAGWLCSIWKLPADVAMVVTNHHEFTIDGRVHPLAACVALADALSTELGYGAPNELQARQKQDATDALRLDDSSLRRLRSQAEDTLTAIPT